MIFHSHNFCVRKFEAIFDYIYVFCCIVFNVRLILSLSLCLCFRLLLLLWIWDGFVLLLFTHTFIVSFSPCILIISIVSSLDFSVYFYFITFHLVCKSFFYYLPLHPCQIEQLACIKIKTQITNKLTSFGFIVSTLFLSLALNKSIRRQCSFSREKKVDILFFYYCSTLYQQGFCSCCIRDQCLAYERFSRTRKKRILLKISTFYFQSTPYQLIC